MNLWGWKSNSPETLHSDDGIDGDDDMTSDEVKNMFKPFTKKIDDSNPTITPFLI